MKSEPSFGEAFKLHQAVQVIVSTAFHDNVAIWPDHAATALTAAFPKCELSPDQVRRAVIDAAAQAGVATISVGFAQDRPEPACGESRVSP